MARCCIIFPCEKSLTVDDFLFLAYFNEMHEIALTTSLLEIAEQEMRLHGASRLTVLRVRYGILSNVVPDAMRMSFAALTANTPHASARLELVEEVLSLRCRACDHIFAASDRESVFLPCPACSTLGGYAVEKGEGVFLDHLEAE